jgi:phosphatidyl-myo-inositol dimannoside synthase
MSPQRHLLVTNDFPPKVGGIQSYLWELWSRLDPDTFSVLTPSSDPGAASFDARHAEKGIQIERVHSKTLIMPTKRTGAMVSEAIERTKAELVIIDPAFPLAHLATRLDVRTATLLHGAEVTIPRRLPLVNRWFAGTLEACDGWIAAGPYPRQQAELAVGHSRSDVLEIPPGVDTNRFAPLDERARRAARAELGIADDAVVISSVSRLVPRKGMDVLIEAAAILANQVENLAVVIGGTGRDEARLRRLIERKRAPVVLAGRIDDERLPRLLGASDLFVMDCRSRWAGLEEEGFGIVFLEAAAAGVAQVAGRSGGSSDAVVDGETGRIVENPRDPRELATVIAELLGDDARRLAMGRAARTRAQASFDYDVLARRLRDALDAGWPARRPG